MKHVLAAMMMSILIVGCIPEKPDLGEDGLPVTAETSPALSEDQLVEEWLAIAANPEAHEGSIRPFRICDDLAKMGPTALSPFIDLLGDSEASGATKVFVLQSINVNMTLAYIPQLFDLLEASDPTARSCATSLLGSIRDESVVERLIQLKEDDNAGVSFSALSGLAQQVGDPYRSEFVGYYFSDDITRARKSEIIRVILLRPTASDLSIVEAEITGADTEIGIRHVATMLIGNMGNLDSIPALEKAMTVEQDDRYKQLALSTIAALQERFKA